jgi:hypothetical protein
MNNIMQKISEEFSKGNSEFAEPYNADDIIWNCIGKEVIHGKA